LLATLAVKGRASKTGLSRVGARLGVDRNGCVTRDDILRRDLAGPTFKPGASAYVVLSRRTCVAPETCGGGRVANVCGGVPAWSHHPSLTSRRVGGYVSGSMPIRIMTWNIQQYGVKRSGDAVKTSLIGNRIAAHDVDIFVLIELNAKQGDAAIDILSKRLIPEIEGWYQKLHGTTETYRYTIAYGHDIGSYAFVYKSAIRSCSLRSSDPDVVNDLTKVKFIPSQSSTSFNASTSKLDYYFPRLQENSGSKWYSRTPCFGGFQIGNNYLFFVALHNSATLAWGGYNLKHLDVFDVIYKKLKLNINGTAVDSDTLVITGDFNVDHTNKKQIDWYYQELISSNAYDIQIPPGAEIDRKTHLLEYDGVTSYKSSLDLRSFGLDNFFTRRNVVNAAKPEIVDIPKWIHDEKDVYKSLIKSSHLTDADKLTELSFELIKERVSSLVKDGSAAAKVCAVVDGAKVKNDDLDKKSLDEISKTVNNEELFKEIREVVKQRLKHRTILFFRFSELLTSNRTSLSWSEALLLSRLISDHLPIYVELS